MSQQTTIKLELSENIVKNINWKNLLDYFTKLLDYYGSTTNAKNANSVVGIKRGEGEIDVRRKKYLVHDELIKIVAPLENPKLLNSDSKLIACPHPDAILYPLVGLAVIRKNTDRYFLIDQT